MNKKAYITREEQMKCKKVAEAFSELYELENIVVLDVGRFGFVKLQYYRPPQGFDNVVTFTDSKDMFEDLWQEWLDTKLYLLAKEKQLEEMDYEKVFAGLPVEEQQKLVDRKQVFVEKAGITL